MNYYPGHQIKEDEIDRTCGMYGEMRNAYRYLVGKLEGRRSLRKSSVIGRIIL
jgi:hypothetical protein